MSIDFDLLGDPIPDGFGKRGRPPHIPTDEKRKLIIQLLAFDWSMEKIAAALSVTGPTLRKHYFRELKFKEEARARVDAKLIGNLMAEVENGNVSAIDKYMKRLDKHDLKMTSELVANRGSVKREPKLGKKEEAKKRASEVRGKFAPPDEPKFLN